MAELLALMRYAGALADCREQHELRGRIEALPRVLGAETVMVASCRNWGGEIELEIGDQAIVEDAMLAAMGRSWEDHPVLTRHLARANPAVQRLSDHIVARDWRSRELFNDFYRPLGMTRELALQLAWGPVGSSCCATVHRNGSDFSDDDVRALQLIAPHLRAARERIAESDRIAARIRLLDCGVEGMRGALLVGGGGHVLLAGAHARTLLARWFGGRAGVLPEPLADWRDAARGLPEPPPFDAAREARRLRARLVPGTEEDLVLLTERGTTDVDPSALARALPISRREADVLARLAAGRTNDGIAHDLGISRHTVVRHVERIYAKLDVRTRAAATRAALEALGWE